VERLLLFKGAMDRLIWGDGSHSTLGAGGEYKSKVLCDKLCCGGYRASIIVDLDTSGAITGMAWVLARQGWEGCWKEMDISEALFDGLMVAVLLTFFVKNCEIAVLYFISQYCFYVLLVHRGGTDNNHGRSHVTKPASHANCKT
jgi:hypothetical protein